MQIYNYFFCETFQKLDIFIKKNPFCPDTVMFQYLAQYRFNPETQKKHRYLCGKS
jgi:hypothetical protein